MSRVGKVVTISESSLHGSTKRLSNVSRSSRSFHRPKSRSSSQILDINSSQPSHVDDTTPISQEQVQEEDEFIHYIEQLQSITREKLSTLEREYTSLTRGSTRKTTSSPLMAFHQEDNFASQIPNVPQKLIQKLNKDVKDHVVLLENNSDKFFDELVECMTVRERELLSMMNLQDQKMRISNGEVDRGDVNDEEIIEKDVVKEDTGVAQVVEVECSSKPDLREAWSEEQKKEVTNEDQAQETSEAQIEPKLKVIKKKRSPKKSPTKPQPFNFTPTQETSSYRWLLQVISDQYDAETAILKAQFKARPAPKTSLVPLYEALLRRQEEERKQRVEMRREEWKRTQLVLESDKEKKDFSKLHREKCPAYHPATEEPSSPEPPKSPVPPSLSSRPTSPTKPRIVETAAEQGRQRRLTLLANELKVGLTEHHTFVPNVNTRIPDFKKLQEEFEQSIKKKKDKKTATKPRPFDFLTRPPKISTRKSSSASTATLHPPSTRKQNRPSSPTRSEPPVTPKMTRSFQLRVSDLEQKKQEEKLMQSIMEEEQSRRQERLRIMSQRIRECLVQRPSSPRPDYAGSRRETQRGYEEFVKEMKERIANRTLMIESEVLTESPKSAKRFEFEQSEKPVPWMY